VPTGVLEKICRLAGERGIGFQPVMSVVTGWKPIPFIVQRLLPEKPAQNFHLILDCGTFDWCNAQPLPDQKYFRKTV